MTVCLAKKSGPTRFVVISHAVALAPFSQYSNTCGSAGLIQAQLTQVKPRGLFCCVSTRAPLTGTPSLDRITPRERTEPQPPAGPL